MIVKLGMVFEDDTLPDFGDIVYDKNNNLILTNDSLIKLVTNVTRDVCGAAFNVPVGTKATVVDTGAVFVYHANDRWYTLSQQKYNLQGDAPAFTDLSRWVDPETYPAGYVQFKLQKNNENYVLGNDETITITLSESNSIIYTGVLTKNDYMGNGYYAGYLNPEQAKQVRNLSEFWITIIVKRGSDDITDTLTISGEDVIQWYDRVYGCNCRSD